MPLSPDVLVRLTASKQQPFTDSEISVSELSNIFDHDWVMVGRAGSIPNPGDYFTAFVGQRPIIIIRQRDGSILSLANYRLHRYVQLLEGSGSESVLCTHITVGLMT